MFAAASVVNRPRNQLFSGSGFTEQQDSRITGRNRFNLLQYVLFLLLPWPQEVSSSNLDAPTNSLSNNDLQSIIFALLHFGANLGTFGNVHAEK